MRAWSVTAVKLACATGSSIGGLFRNLAGKGPTRWTFTSKVVHIDYNPADNTITMTGKSKSFDGFIEDSIIEESIEII